MKKLILFLILSSSAVAFYGCKKTLFSKNDNVTPNNFLSDKKYEKLVVEIQCVNGYVPKAESISNMISFLQKRLNKPRGIVVSQNYISSPGKTLYSVTDIKNVEENHRTEHTKGDVLTVYILFLDGEYEGNSGNSKTLGIAYGNSSIVIFENTVRSYSGGVGQPKTEVLETTVIDHELGHLMGLVNNGTDMQINHQDAGNAHHCNNKSCLMHYLVESSDVISNLIGNDIPELDNNCIADLRANGGK